MKLNEWGMPVYGPEDNPKWIPVYWQCKMCGTDNILRRPQPAHTIDILGDGTIRSSWYVKCNKCNGTQITVTESK